MFRTRDIILPFVLIISFQEASAQLAPSTFAEIYDFNVGDTLFIGAGSYGWADFSSITRKTYKTKQIIGDSVSYRVESYKITSDFSNDPVEHHYQHTLTIEKYRYDTLPITNILIRGCSAGSPSSYDTIYTSSRYCGRKMNDLYRTFPDAFGGIHVNAAFVPGLGRVEYFANGETCNKDTILIYYNKMGERCGDAIPFHFVGMDDRINDSRVSISPNPANAAFNIEVNNPSISIQSVVLLSIIGEPVLSLSPANTGRVSLNTEHIPKGFYLCHIALSNKEKVVAKILIE